MKRGYLSEYFDAVAVKTLSRVDATPKSNQHEVGTTAEMRPVAASANPASAPATPLVVNNR